MYFLVHCIVSDYCQVKKITKNNAAGSVKGPWLLQSQLLSKIHFFSLAWRRSIKSVLWLVPRAASALKIATLRWWVDGKQSSRRWFGLECKQESDEANIVALKQWRVSTLAAQQREHTNYVKIPKLGSGMRIPACCISEIHLFSLVFKNLIRWDRSFLCVNAAH